MGPTFTHFKINTDLETAKDGRWVLLLNPKIGDDRAEDTSDYDGDHIPPVVVAKWVSGMFGPDIYARWTYLNAYGQVEGHYIENAMGYVELSDLGLIRVTRTSDQP